MAAGRASERAAVQFLAQNRSRSPRCLAPPKLLREPLTDTAAPPALLRATPGSSLVPRHLATRSHDGGRRAQGRQGDAPPQQGARRRPDPDQALLKEGADFAAKGNTTRQWTPLHIACWGTSKPQNDREIVEAILLAAQKAGKESDVRNAKDAKDGATPADLAKERRETQTGSNVDDKEQLDEKRKLDKIIEWVRRAAARRTRPPPAAPAASPTDAAPLPPRSSRRACRRERN